MYTLEGWVSAEENFRKAIAPRSKLCHRPPLVACRVPGRHEERPDQAIAETQTRSGT